MARGSPLNPHLLERLLQQWNDPEGRMRLFVLANLVAFAMLVMGVVLIVLVLMGRFPKP